MKEMSGDFLYHIISSIDGERDPKNLNLIFSFMPKFLNTYPLLHLREEMFEVFACYFPIDFNPLKNDAETITRDLLAEKLSQCLVATSLFADLAINLALEKLSSELVVAKCDSLELLVRYFFNYIYFTFVCILGIAIRIFLCWFWSGFTYRFFLNDNFWIII